MSGTIKGGDRASYRVGSDRHPATVVAASRSRHWVALRRVEVTQWAPHPDCRGLEFADHGDGEVVVATRRKDGSYRLAGRDGGRVTFGAWEAYCDPHV